MKFIIKNLEKFITITGIANIHFFEFPGDYYTKMDSHPFYELVYVSNGSLQINSDKYTGNLQKQQMILHYPNENHCLICKNTPPTIIIIGFSLEGNLPAVLSSKPIDLTNKQIKYLAEIIKEGRNVFAPPYDIPTYDMKKKKNIPLGSEQMLKNLLEYFLIDISRKEDKVNNIKSQSDTFSCNEIISYLNDNYKEKITLDELSFLFNTNRTTLCREFKNKMNISINEYIINKKIQQAMLMLKSNNYSITQIAEELNFNSIHYFTRLFKTKTGLTPTKYSKTDNK